VSEENYRSSRGARSEREVGQGVTMRFTRALVLLSIFVASSSFAADGAPVVIPHAQQFDLVAQATGRTYRINVALPEKFDAAKKYPVFYVLDGNWYFAPTAVNLAESSGARELLPAVVVGIGYPTDDFGPFATRRLLELTHSKLPNSKYEMGDADGFLKFLVEELKPWVAAHYPIDTEQETIYGKSLGGLAVLRLLFRQPDAFDNYIAASPSIWWNNRDVLADEAAFSARAKSGQLRLRLLLTVAGEEQYRGPDEARRKGDDESRMIDNASELATRLGALDPVHVQVTFATFADETHVSVSLASLGRALSFALQPLKKY
jgi:hypothetical protein